MVGVHRSPGGVDPLSPYHSSGCASAVGGLGVRRPYVAIPDGGVPEMDQVERPWPLPISPGYQCGQFGRWRLRRAPDRTCFGYFTSWQVSRQNFVLKHEDVIWMSVSPMERESQAHHIASARGHVVIGGLGMGVLLYNVISKPEVTRVTVIERDRRLIRLFKDFICEDHEQWAGWDKVTIIPYDILRPEAAIGDVDTLLVDIWPTLADDRAMPQMRQLIRRYQPEVVGWWGQEFDFIGWLAKEKFGPPIEPGMLSSFQDHLGCELAGADRDDYHELAVYPIGNWECLVQHFPPPRGPVAVREITREEFDELVRPTSVVRAGLSATG